MFKCLKPPSFKLFGFTVLRAIGKTANFVQFLGIHVTLHLEWQPNFFTINQPFLLQLNFVRSSLEEYSGFEFSYIPLVVEDEDTFQFNTGILIKNPTKTTRNNRNNFR